jgi:hypothetical protein
MPQPVEQCIDKWFLLEQIIPVLRGQVKCGEYYYAGPKFGETRNSSLISASLTA